MGLLDRLVPSSGHSAKIVAGYHPRLKHLDADESTPTADILPTPNGLAAPRGQIRKHILVVVTGSELDRELVSLACTLAKVKHVDVVAVYGIAVPRTLPVDAEMPEETNAASQALDTATGIADRCSVHLEPEIIQSRHVGQSVVEEGDAHACALVVLALPYPGGHQGHFDLGETADYVLKNAPCRVWVVRGEQPVHQEEAAREELRSKPQALV